MKEQPEYDYLELYGKLKNHHVSFQLYNFTLDWLYLISAVEFDKKDGVVKCI